MTMTAINDWTADTLEAAIFKAAAERGIHCSRIGADVIKTVVGKEEVEIFISVSQTQVLTSAILWPRDTQNDPAAFEAMMLRNHKNLLPLNALAITEVDGREYYELFGAMQIGTPIDSLLDELIVTAGNVLELAEDFASQKAA